MMYALMTDRDVKVEEYLQLLQGLARELQRAMTAISENSLTDFEESVSNQQEMSVRLAELASELRGSPTPKSTAQEVSANDGLMLEIQVASAALQSLNQRYAALILHSSRSVAMMVSLFNSIKGNLQEVPGARPKLQTWSCEV
jgi:hypothetical protein